MNRRSTAESPAELGRRTGMTHGAPGSLVDVKKLAPILMASTGLVTIVEGSMVGHGEGALVALGAFGIPTVGTSLLGFFLAHRRWSAAMAAGVSASLAHVLLAIVLSGGSEVGLVSIMALVVDGITLALALPALAACAVLGPRRDLDAGDTLLGVGGLWFAAVQSVKLAFASQGGGGLEAYVFAFGLALGLAAVGLSVQRAIARRAWCAKVQKGLVSGWRVREDARADEIEGLVPLYGGPRATEVLERFEEQPGPYRGTILARPVAMVPAS